MTQQRHDFSIQPRSVEVARARRHVAEVFHDLDGDVRSTLQVLTSELVTNAIAHGAGDIVLRTSRASGEARVEVLDESPQAPRVGTPTDDAESGRGLLLLDALASAWGVHPLSGRPGKSVWFTLQV